jgi:large subunit ribosomal protein L9
MKVILLRDVAKIGRRFDLVEVPDGYASNQLIPKLWAEPATPQNLKKIQKRQTETVTKKNATLEQFHAIKHALQETKLEIEAEANEKNHLFKAVNVNDIVEKAKMANIFIDATMIKISQPIKELGEHSIQLISGKDIAEIVIKVIKK